MTARRYADLAALVLSRPARLGRVRFVAIDGPAGSGKTRFAARLAAALRDAGARVAVVHVDDLLDGWDDLAGYWARFAAGVLTPLGTGRPGRYHRYDWHRAGFEPDLTTVDVPDVLLLEGVGSARTQAAQALTFAAFVVAPRELRLDRCVARDGEALRGELVRWMSAEDRHFEGDGTEARADLIVDGAPATPHDPDREYVAR